MKPIIFTKNCTFKDKSFLEGQELKNIKKRDLSDIWRLNEKGFIEPLNEDEFLEIVKSFEQKTKKEEE